jgi:hypothetical protein
MRSTIVPQFPKLAPMLWVLKNKFLVSMNRPIDFERYVDYASVHESPHVQRVSFLGEKVKAKLQRGRNTVEARYPLKEFSNR